jgi:hypothetical protein
MKFTFAKNNSKLMTDQPKEKDIHSQVELILHHLKTGKSLTPIQALQSFGCFRLSARIWDLRNEGHNIEMKMIGQKKRYARYFMPEFYKEKKEAEISLTFTK